MSMEKRRAQSFNSFEQRFRRKHDFNIKLLSKKNTFFNIQESAKAFFSKNDLN